MADGSGFMAMAQAALASSGTPSRGSTNEPSAIQEPGVLDFGTVHPAKKDIGTAIPATPAPSGEAAAMPSTALSMLQQGVEGKLPLSPPQGQGYGPAPAQQQDDSLTSKATNATTSLMNQLLAAYQGTSPIVTDMHGNLNYKPLGPLVDTDAGSMISTDKGPIPFDQTSHVQLLDPTGKMMAYERNSDMDEDRFHALGRLLSFGMLAPNNIATPAVTQGATAASRLADFEKSGIQPSIPAVTQGYGSGLLAKTIGSLPYVGQPVQSGIAKAIEQAGAAAPKIASKFGDAALPEEGGQAAQKGVAAFMGDKEAATPSLETAVSTPTRDIGFQNKASALYDAVPIADTTKMYQPETLKTLQGISSKFPSNPQFGATLQPSTFKKWLDLLQRGGRDTATGQFKDPRLSWGEVKQFRSYVGQNMRNPPGELGVGPDDMRRLYGAVSQDMKMAATKGGPGALKAFNRANNYYSAGLDRIKNALDIIDKADSPEKAYYALTRMASERGKGADIAALTRIMRSLPEEARGDIASTVIRRMGLPNAGAVANAAHGGEGAGFSINTFTTNFAALSDKAKDVLFGAKGTEGRDTLDAFARAVGNLKNVERLGNPSGTGRHTMTSIGLWELGKGVVHGEIPYEALIGGAMLYGGAKALMYPPMAKWLVGAAGAMRNQSFPAYITRLKVIADQAPEFRPFYDQLNVMQQPQQQSSSESRQSTSAQIAAPPPG